MRFSSDVRCACSFYDTAFESKRNLAVGKPIYAHIYAVNILRKTKQNELQTTEEFRISAIMHSFVRLNAEIRLLVDFFIVSVFLGKFLSIILSAKRFMGAHKNGVARIRMVHARHRTS